MSSMVEQEMTEDRISKLEDKPIKLTLFKQKKNMSLHVFYLFFN